MSTPFTRFKVSGLHGSKTMDVRLQDNKLVLVGENGAGKSTFVNLMYYFLTRQWTRLQEYKFLSLEAYFGDQVLQLTPEDLVQHFEARRRQLAFMHLARGSRPTRIAVENLMELAMQGSPEAIQEATERLSAEFQIPSRMANEMFREYEKQAKGKPTQVQLLTKRLSTLAEGQFLYLPTYRRIEQDLRSIFRGVEIESELRKFRERLERRGGAPYLELVEFGMEDVEQTIARRMAQIKDSVRNGLDNLTGTYLRDVIRGVHTKVTVNSLGEIDPRSLDAVFARIDESTLPNSDKKHLKEKVEAISATHTIEEQDKVIAHFLSKLIELYSEQQEDEKNVREFVSSCNRYLTGKRMVYDNIKYTIYIAQDAVTQKSQETLEMKALSSGEKQIVSLFSHMYLSGEKKFFVIIDEPELSLSVPWQRRFLPDILGTQMCSGLVAVTHSPFIWENELEMYVRPLAEFTSVSDNT